eukprot:TRINITY_DN1916_c0_g1_i1.p1 TRINITY_DN1916_c0_g1~~TRINITY_DN1916_c0_g1_i1.p1  ORF type:complete len:581 (-),score=131.11 TRINITY_DN1916_c0_g1_i1:40-1782(-)
MNSLIGVKVPARLTAEAILSSGFMGILIPLVSSILPITAALSNNLSDSLDTRASKVKAVEVEMERAEEGKLSWSILVVGTFLILFGVSIYYLLPLALLSFNLGLLLNIFICLLVGLLLGMTILSINLNNSLEKLLLTLLLFWERRAIRELVGKNLIAHRQRNRKTTLLYAISLAFIVFISVSYQLQLDSFLFTEQQQNGCYLKVTGSSYDPSDPDSAAITNIAQLEKYAQSEDNIQGYGWISVSLQSINNRYTGTFIENVGHTVSFPVNVFGVSPQLFDVTLKGFLQLSQYDAKAPLLEELYTVRGSHSMIVGSLYEQRVQLKMDSDMVLRTSFRGDDDREANMRKRLSVLATLDSAPAFTFSRYPTIETQDALVSFPTFVRLTNGTLSSVDDIPMKDFIIRLKDSVTSKDIDRVKNGLEQIISSEGKVYIWDYRDQLEPIQKATLILSYFFNFTTLVALIVCWFSLNSSMFANVYQQTKEISILRAMGITKFWMYRIYVYEALVLVLSASILGIIIGAAVGYTMTIQQSLYTQIPIPFVFPKDIVQVVGISSFFFAVLASFAPIHYLLRLPIIAIMRIM